jgi:hypothetical protein
MADFRLDPEQLRARRFRRDLTLILGLVVVVVLGLGALLWVGVTSLGKAVVNGVMTAQYESGAFYAAEAANVAHSEGVSPGAVTLAELQGQQPSAQWLGGSVTVAGNASGTHNEVSVAVSRDHVTTATIPVVGYLCTYGLVVTSATDPVVAADGLPGTGVYSAAGLGSSCAADLAPTSGWTRVSATDLRNMGIEPPPVAG